jgi:prepilin-type N-terminal cleavage/methylation domain-containing protein
MTPRSSSPASGFTLIELMITMTIIAIMGIATFITLQGQKNSNDVTDTTKQVASLLREAQSDSMAQEQGATWGVYFSNATSGPFYSLFINSYSTSTTQGGQYRLPATVGWKSSFLASGATTTIMFSQISGAASASTTVGISLFAQSSFSSTITVASSGAVGD